MRLIHDLHLEQQQKLLITPELRQAIAILQMSSLELSEYLQQEIDENPVLELKEEDDRPEGDMVGEIEEDSQSDMEWWEYFLDRSDLGYTGRHEEERQYNQQHKALAPTLHEHLQFQMHIVLNREEDQRIGGFLIGSIDDNGYLRISLEEAAATLNVSVMQVAEILKVIQAFEPYGVGARDLSECLLIQLTQLGRLSPEVERIVRNYLGDLARGRLAKIAATLKMTVVEVQEIADLIRTLDPKPGRQYASGGDVRYLVPDVTVEKVNDEYVILVNDGNSPRLMISPMYQEMLRQPGLLNNETRKYVDDRINSAIWLIKSIEQRRMTLYNTAKCLVEAQREFLEKGIKYMKPLNLKQIATQVGVHESTISRVTNNKYIQTPQGVFELKYFFCSGLDSRHGTRYSSRSIKRVLKELILEEDAHNPYSDQQIADKLCSKGIQISRRTVAKYRMEMGIESTAKRKRY
ncbi:MAG: RNA polymerase factor sigma-54 [Syntrophomonadales bacterium]|jgi:RNA polymerase sigma-54 factor